MDSNYLICALLVFAYMVIGMLAGFIFQRKERLKRDMSAWLYVPILLWPVVGIAFFFFFSFPRAMHDLYEKFLK